VRSHRVRVHGDPARLGDLVALEDNDHRPVRDGLATQRWRVDAHGVLPARRRIGPDHVLPAQSVDDAVRVRVVVDVAEAAAVGLVEGERRLRRLVAPVDVRPVRIDDVQVQVRFRVPREGDHEIAGRRRVERVGLGDEDLRARGAEVAVLVHGAHDEGVAPQDDPLGEHRRGGEARIVGRRHVGRPGDEHPVPDVVLKADGGRRRRRVHRAADGIVREARPDVVVDEGDLVHVRSARRPLGHRPANELRPGHLHVRVGPRVRPYARRARRGARSREHAHPPEDVQSTHQNTSCPRSVTALSASVVGAPFEPMPSGFRLMSYSSRSRACR
jgi:hypothetical protein